MANEMFHPHGGLCQREENSHTQMIKNITAAVIQVYA
jgi:hypothetical protein